MMHKKPSKIKNLVLPGLLALIMILSVIGYGLTSNSGKQADDFAASYNYQGRQYTRTTDGWQVKIDDQYAVFSYGPRELETIQIPDFQLTSKVYLAYDPDSLNSNIDPITQKLNNILLYKNIRSVKACIKESKNCPDIPIVSCQANDKVISFTETDKPIEIELQGSCLMLKGSIIDLNKATDKLAMSWLGLI